MSFVGTSGIRIVSETETNTMYLQGIPTAISTGVYAYQQINVISNASTFNINAIHNSNNTVLSAMSVSSVLNIAGVGDILLNANSASNAYFISISTFTSKGYLDMSGVAFGTLSSALSTVSTLFYDIPKSVSTTISIISLISNISLGIEQKFEYNDQYLMDNFTQLGTFEEFSTTTKQDFSTLEGDFTALFSDLSTLQDAVYQSTLSTLETTFTISTLNTSTLFVGFSRISTLSTNNITTNNFNTSSINIIGSPTNTYQNLTVSSGYLLLNNQAFTPVLLIQNDCF